MKKNRIGKASVIPDAIADKIIKRCKYPWQQTLLSIMRYTGERVGAVRLLQVSDVYADGSSQIALPEITFRSETRKRSAGKDAGVRQVPVSQKLREVLRTYRPGGSVWLFPSPSDHSSPVTVQAIDSFHRKAIAQLGLQNEGYSLHSYRRTFITKLYDKGISTRTIMEITGHKSMSSLQRYIDADPSKVRKAIDEI
ncbi:tyrosine-type recombinase/integrase [Limnospira platensis]|uniref:tyrosine-type recombinase/integrase n=1 Tax=Limnospira platensis TaxID=118562 RepID=UPI0001D0E513|nr:integrase [Arthrospira platensis YZ]KDR57486.1 integrase [Arthrospira platensis str. Paraca]MBD2713315.1 site-specific integrase [Arthrospira platensis FACHB-835]MDF2211260.1 site-specific integrase [Arthrospira platensis NCB002]QQW31390.1 site-specific integrase [Arthrospira sp. PCC 9108]BAI88706.1 integrase family protein [Arthrospira platensis NIES-39]